MPSLSDPTVQCLLALARPGFGGRHRARALARLPRVDWPRLQRLALACEVPGLVAESLERLGPERAPRQVRQGLLAARLVTARTNRRLLAQSARICGAAGEQGLTLVPLKGAALLLGRPYAGEDLRLMADVDLLARRAEYGRVERLLQRLGFEAEARRGHALRHEHHVRYFLRQGKERVLVELHWTPFQTLFGSRERDRRVFGRLVDHQHGGQRYRLLDGEDSLLSLLSHLEHHRFRGPLKLAVDVTALLSHLGPALDWPLLWRRADALGARAATAYALELIRRLLRPEGWPDMPPASRLRSRALDHLNSPRWLVVGHRRPPLWQRTLIDLLLQDRPLAGLRYLAHKAGEVYERDHGGRAPRALVRGGPRGTG